MIRIEKSTNAPVTGDAGAATGAVTRSEASQGAAGAAPPFEHDATEVRERPAGERKRPPTALFPEARGAARPQPGMGSIELPRRINQQFSMQTQDLLRRVLATAASPHRAELVALLEDPHYASLPISTQADMVALIVADVERVGLGEPVRMLALHRLVCSEDLRALGRDDQRMLLDVWPVLTPKAQDNLLQLLGRDTFAWESPRRPEALLASADSRGGSLLSNLHAIATAPMDPVFNLYSVPRADVLASVLEEIASPGQIDQHFKGTCTVTTMQYMLALDQPAEYARLVAGLISPSGRVRMHGGGELVRLTDSLPLDRDTTRSASERLFQAAMMEYANGKGIYSSITDETIRSYRVLWYRYGGLSDWESKRALQALFGRNFDQVYNWSQHVPGQLGSERFLNAVQRSAPVWGSMEWGGGGHAVLITKVEGGRVYLRNPWGPQLHHANGSSLTNPPRRMEDNRNGLESMTVADFLARADSLLRPDS